MRRADRGSAAVEFVLVTLVLVPLVVGILNLALASFVRSSLTAAAAEGARIGARADQGPAAGAAHTRRQIGDALAGRYARDVTGRYASVRGAPGVEVIVRARVPALGLGGLGLELEVAGHAIREPL